MKYKVSQISNAVCLVAYLLTLVVLSSYHEFWLDEIHPWEMDVNMSLGEVVAAMAGEGHFATWHLLLMPLAKLGVNSVWGMPLVSILLMGAGAWWLLYRSAFSLAAKFCILFSLPSVYLFSVLCRVYAIIPLALWLVAYYYQRRSQQPVAYGLSLGLLFNTHLYMEGLAIMLFVLWVVEVCTTARRLGARSGQILQSELSGRRLLLRRQVVGVGIAAALALIAFAQIAGNFFMPDTVAYKRLSTIQQLAMEMPDRYLSILNIALSKAGSSLVSPGVISAVLFLSLAAVYCLLLRGSLKPLIIVMVGILYQVVFALHIYFFDGQRFYLPFYIMIFGLWIAGRAQLRSTTWFVVALFLLNINVCYSVVKADIDSTYEIYQHAAAEYQADDSDLKLIHWPSMSVRIVTSCFGQEPDAGSAFDDASQLFDIIGNAAPERFAVYGSMQPWEKLPKAIDYPSVCDTISALGYKVEYHERPFVQIPGYFVIIKASR